MKLCSKTEQTQTWGELWEYPPFQIICPWTLSWSGGKSPGPLGLPSCFLEAPPSQPMVPPTPFFPLLCCIHTFGSSELMSASGVADSWPPDWVYEERKGRWCLYLSGKRPENLDWGPVCLWSESEFIHSDRVVDAAQNGISDSNEAMKLESKQRKKPKPVF